MYTLDLESVAELIFVTLNAVKSLKFSKVEILLRRSPLDISLMIANNQVAPFRMTIQTCTTQTLGTGKKIRLCFRLVNKN